MQDYMERTFPVFRMGAHTDSQGNTRTWTASDLARIASTYNPALHEAPVVIGHPEDNSPAWGWVKGVSVDGDTLCAKAELVPEFEEMVKKGLFKKRSISLYPDGSLRHVGFLGAKPPAIKGLPDIRFGEGEATTIEFAEDPKVIHQEGGKTMKFFEWIRQMAGKEGVTLDDLPAMPDRAASFSEADLQARIDQARKDERAKADREYARASIASFCEDLAKEGRLTPAMMKTGMGMTNFLERIGSIETPIEFGEGEGRAKQTPLEFMQAFLRGLPKSIEFREVATTEKDLGAGDDADKRERLIGSYMEHNPKASYRDAVLAVSTENPDLFQGRAD
jgi:hypothetical protein